MRPGAKTTRAMSADVRRIDAERAGRSAEWLAAVLLLLRGYRLLAVRHRNRFGEIDLIGVRGRRLAFVEVKLRATPSEAEQTLADCDPRRLHAAAEHWVARRPSYAAYELGFDAVLIVPWRLPSYRRDALQPR